MDILAFLQKIISEHGYFTIFIFMLLENIFLLGFFVPGTIILAFAGFYASNNLLDINALILIGFFGVLLGDNISYIVGKYLISRFKILSYWRYEIERNQDVFTAKTNWFILIYHITSISRMIFPVFLGLTKYNFKNWFIYNTLGSLLFVILFSMLGFYMGETNKLISESYKYNNLVEWLSLVFLVIWMLLIRSVFSRIAKTDE